MPLPPWLTLVMPQQRQGEAESRLALAPGDCLAGGAEVTWRARVPGVFLAGGAAVTWHPKCVTTAATRVETAKAPSVGSWVPA